MSKMKVYLAGAMSGLSFNQMNNWRVKATSLLKDESDNNIHIVNPVDYYNFEMDRDTYSDKEVKEFDLNMVKASDLILVNLDNPNSIGTAIELHMAHDVWQKPVIGFGDTQNIAHPWMKLSLTKKCNILNEAVDYILDFYLPNF